MRIEFARYFRTHTIACMISVLIVDDDVNLCQVIADELTRAGYATREVHDGRDVVKLFEEQPSDVVITDLFMPNVDGLEVIRHLHRVAPGVCIIAMTGVGDPGADYLKAARAFGASHVLRKPFRIAELLDAVTACSPEAV